MFPQTMGSHAFPKLTPDTTIQPVVYLCHSVHGNHLWHVNLSYNNQVAQLMNNILMLIKDAPVTYFPPLSKHRPDVSKPTPTNKIKT